MYCMPILSRSWSKQKKEVTEKVDGLLGRNCHKNPLCSCKIRLRVVH